MFYVTSEIASAGLVVIGSQYRGSRANNTPNNGKDEFGGDDVNDVLALQSILVEIPEADMSQISLVGWSRGVMQSYLVAKQMHNLKAIVSIAGNSDARKSLEWRSEMEKVYMARVPNYEANKVQELSKRSVVDWVDELGGTPILLIHGSGDKRVNVE
ncbi:alpha/beta hydrolase family protein [Glaciecola sp. 1036]|uniref:alpha/beta hydrolase family protein n=1 Tax=Alteromonadaceae TaxID=72275 RepID=UPI003CFBFD34